MNFYIRTLAINEAEKIKTFDKYFAMIGVPTYSDLVQHGFKKDYALSLCNNLANNTKEFFELEQGTNNFIIKQDKIKTFERNSYGIPFYFLRNFLTVCNIINIMDRKRKHDIFSKIKQIISHQKLHFLQLVFCGLLLGKVEFVSQLITDPFNADIFFSTTGYDNFTPTVLKEYRYQENDKIFLSKFDELKIKLHFGYFPKGKMLLENAKNISIINDPENSPKLPDYQTVDDLRENDEIVIFI